MSSSAAGQPAELSEMMARSQEVRDGGAERDPIADMQWALRTQPPDFLALVSLVQRVGRPVLGVVEEESQRTPLHIASLYAKIAYAAMLISRGADIEAKDSSLWTPLMSAAFGESRSSAGAVAVAKLLLTHNADVNTKCLHGTTSLHVVASYGSPEFAKLLVDRGATIDAVDVYGEAPLHKGALRGDMVIVRYLVECGANVGVRASCGSTPAELAEAEGTPEHVEIANFLRRHCP